ncbi:hypothetical protein KAW65_08695, partial [candidate division WOR-3 bacterium]|nr:hypothetical protein [candidate division WOR-3 bacterium]
MIGLILLFVVASDTLYYDDGIADGFYTVGEYKNDKFAVRFLPPYPLYKVLGVLVLADGPSGFKGGSLCYDEGGMPNITTPWLELDTVYSRYKEWALTPFEIEIKNTQPFWFVLNMAGYPAVGGDTNNPSGESWYYSNSSGWKKTLNYNWLIRLIIKEEEGYYEDFVFSDSGYTGDWEWGVPSIISGWKNNCMGTRLDTLYPSNTYLQLESPWIKDYGFLDPTLTFYHFYQTEYEMDGGNVKISQDTINWTLITPVGGYDTKLVDNTAGIGEENAFSGSSLGWKKIRFSLPKCDSLKIRWCFGSDPGPNEYLGWFIDEIRLREKPPHDVMPVSINLQKLVPPETTIPLQVEIRNLGIYEENNFTVCCTIKGIYQDQKVISSIMPETTLKVDFKPLNTPEKGVRCTLQVYTALPEDEDKTNDTLEFTFLAFPLVKSFVSKSTDSAPVIDGIIDSIEWKDAKIIDGSDVGGVDTPNPIDACNLYFMNDSFNFYIACKIDTTSLPTSSEGIPFRTSSERGHFPLPTSIERIVIYIDDSGDGEWALNEGFYWITQDTFLFIDMFCPGPGLVYSLPESLKSINIQEAEIAIPIGQEPYEINYGESLGCFIYVVSCAGGTSAFGGKNEYIGWWLQSVPLTNYTNPAHYAKIKLTSVGVEEITKPCKAWLKVAPNPFIGKTVIQYAVSSKQYGENGKELPADYSLLPTICIYDLSGRLVHTFPLLTSHF